MNNLKIKNIAYHAFSIPRVDQAIYVDNLMFVRAGPSVHLYREQDEWITIAHRMDHIEHHSMLNALVSRNSKELIVVDLSSKKEVIISLPNEYLALEWNPAKDLFVLVDDEMNLQLAYVNIEKKECVVVQVYNLLQKSENSFVNLGWGSEKTQFRGSEGKKTEEKTDEKEAMEPTPKATEPITLELIRSTVELNREENALKIAWCDIGDIFTVSYIFQGVRYFKTFDKDLQFLNELESKPGMGKHMTWRPDGSYLAVECDDKARKLLFFERNGLYYREQRLTYPDAIERMAWNPKQSLLLVWQANEMRTIATIWAAYTSTWIMKQCLTFDHLNNRVNDISWFEDKIQVITDKYLYVYSFIFEQDRTACILETDKLTGDQIIQAVAHIDGLYLNISIFEQLIQPPPLFAFQIKMDRPMRQVIFGQNTNTIAVIFHDFTVRVYNFTRTSYKEVERHGIVVPSKDFICFNFVYDDLNMHILTCGRTPDTAKQIITYNMITEELTFSQDIDIDRFTLPERYFDLVPVMNTERDSFYFALLRDCNYILYQNFEGHSTRFIENEYVWGHNLENAKGNVYIARVDNVLYSFYREDSKLYLNGVKIHNKITSIIFDQEFLLLTTTTDNLIAITVNAESLDLMQKGEFESFFTRSIPTKAVILCMIPVERQVVLYLTNRDETEVITPRIMSIAKIDKLLDEKKHISAYRITRADRINPNVLYDMKPKRFENDVEEFVKNVSYVDMIDQFLLSIENNADVTCNVYGYVVEDKWKITDDDIPKKQRIANCMIAAMKKLDEAYYLQSIVTAYHILGTVEGLKLALIELYRAKRLNEKGTFYKKKPSAVLQHFLTIAQFDPLYEAALILDNKEITKWLLSMSHIDPLEYMPFLKEIEKLPPMYRKYKIYMQVKLYDDALKFLLRSEKIDGVDTLGLIKQLLTKHNLFNLVIHYIDRGSLYYEDVMLYYAEHMRDNNRNNEAGVIYFNLGKKYYLDAFHCFCKYGNVKEAIMVGKLMNAESQLRQSFLDLTQMLVSSKRLAEAATVYEEALHNPEQAFTLLVSGEFWSEANYLATKYHRRDLIVGNLFPILIKSTKDNMANMKSIRSEFTSLFFRLEKIRQEKIEQYSKSGQTTAVNSQPPTLEALDARDGIDTASITSKQSILGPVSEASFTSTSTTRRKKKLERKLISTKEGSTYEAVGLLTSLYHLVDGVYRSVESVTNTCNYLFMFPEHVALGVKLQNLFDEMYNYIQSALPKIWTTDITQINLDAKREQSPTRIVHRLHLENIDFKFHHPPPEPVIKWKPLFN